MDLQELSMWGGQQHRGGMASMVQGNAMPGNDDIRNMNLASMGRHGPGFGGAGMGGMSPMQQMNQRNRPGMMGGRGMGMQQANMKRGGNRQ